MISKGYVNGNIYSLRKKNKDEEDDFFDIFQKNRK